MAAVDISGLDKLRLLEALWQGSRTAGFFRASGVAAPEFDVEEARIEGERCGWDFDYFNGRVIKLNLSGDFVNPWGYDRDCGQGAVARVVSSLRDRG